MRKHSDAVRAKVAENLGKTCDREIAEKCNASISYVRRLRNDLGIAPYRKFKKAVPRFKLVALTDEEIYKEYKSMGTLEQVARKYGCTRQAVFLRVLNYKRSINEI